VCRSSSACYKSEVDGKTTDALEVAENACPDQEPILRIETGMHMAAIRSIGVDAQCRIAATGSGDKTVQLWSMPHGKPYQPMRLDFAL